LHAGTITLVELACNFLQELRDLIGKHLARQVRERIPHVIAKMRNARTDREKNEERRKDSQELVESHSATLTKNVVPPGRTSCPAK
jgi:hypothetical protein